MATYNSLIVRSEVPMAEDRIPEIFKLASEESVVMSLGRKLRNARKDELKLRVTSNLPTVYWVDEKGKSSTYPNTNLKQTTEAGWEDVTLYLRELAAIIPVPENVLNDADFDIMGELKQELAAAIAREVDRVTLFGEAGVNSPDDFIDGIYQGMPAAHVISHASFTGDIYDELAGDLGALAQVELDGYDPTAILASPRMRGMVRGLRADSGTGAPIFNPEANTLVGLPVRFTHRLPHATVWAIAGDWSQLVWTIAQDVKFDVFDTGVIQDGNGAITHNLMQEDLVALRVTFRYGFQLPTPATEVTVSGVQYPFAAITA